MSRPGVAQKIKEKGVRYVVWLDGDTDKVAGGGSMSCAAGPGGGGCFGFAWWQNDSNYSYAKAGKHLPRTTAEQWRMLQPVKEGALRIGDLLFFKINGSVSHVGLYLGDRRFVHAPSTGRQVSVESLDAEFYERRFLRAARPD